LQIAIQLQSAP